MTLLVYLIGFAALYFLIVALNIWSAVRAAKDKDEDNNDDDQ